MERNQRLGRAYRGGAQRQDERTFIFYVSPHYAIGAQPIALPGSAGFVYIRVEEHAGDLSAALEDAQCRQGESLMNTHSFPVRDGHEQKP